MDGQQAETYRPAVSSMGYWIGIAIIVCGIGGGAWLGYRGVRGLINEFGRGPSVVVPCSRTVELPSGGEHTIMVSLESSRNLSSDDPGMRALANAVQVELFNADGNEPIPTHAGMDVNYHWPGKVGFSIGSADVGSTRRVRVHAEVVEDMLPADGKLLDRVETVKVHLVKMNIMGAVGKFLIAGAMLFVGIVLGLVFIIVTVTRRSKSKRAADTAFVSPGAPAGQSPPPTVPQSPPAPPRQ